MDLKPAVSTAETGEGAVLLDEDTGEIVTLNTSGYGCLKAALDGGVKTAITWLETTYGLNHSQARKDTQRFLRQLHDRGMLR